MKKQSARSLLDLGASDTERTCGATSAHAPLKSSWYASWRHRELLSPSALLLPLIIGLLSPLAASATPTQREESELERGRQLFYQAVAEESAMEKAREVFLSLQSHPPEADGYLAALSALKGKHAFAPWQKLKLTNEGLKELDAAVEKHPENLEVRFLRAVTLSFLPSLFGYRDVLTEDVRVLAKNFPTAASSLPIKRKRDIGLFLLKRSELNSDEKQSLRGVIEEQNGAS